MQGILIVRFFATEQDTVARVAEAIRGQLPPGTAVQAAIGAAAEHILSAVETAPRMPPEPAALRPAATENVTRLRGSLTEPPAVQTQMSGEPLDTASLRPAPAVDWDPDKATVIRFDTDDR
jgi:hypothetical protein